MTLKYNSQVSREVWEQLSNFTIQLWPTFDRGEFSWDCYSAVLQRIRYEEVVIERWNGGYWSNASPERLEEVLIKAMLVLS